MHLLWPVNTDMTDVLHAVSLLVLNVTGWVEGSGYDLLYRSLWNVPYSTVWKIIKTIDHKKKIWSRAGLEGNFSSTITSERSWVSSMGFCSEKQSFHSTGNATRDAKTTAWRASRHGKMQESGKDSYVLARNKYRHWQNGLKLWNSPKTSGKTTKRAHNNNRLARRTVAESSDWFVSSGWKKWPAGKWLSNYPEMALLPSMSATCVIRHMKSLFARHGIPQIVHSDNGPCYSCKEFKDFAEEYDFRHVTSSCSPSLMGKQKKECT